jgi:hypothetical protein
MKTYSIQSAGETGATNMKLSQLKEAIAEAIRLSWVSKETSGRVIVRRDLSVIYDEAEARGPADDGIIYSIRPHGLGLKSESDATEDDYRDEKVYTAQEIAEAVERIDGETLCEIAAKLEE